MLHFRMQDGVVVEARVIESAEYKAISESKGWLPGYNNADTAIVLKESGWFCRWEIPAFETAEKIAEDLNVAAMRAGKVGIRFVATDAGPCVSPRYDVIEVPSIGDKVSRYFNGDSYPAGTIKSVSKSLRRVETTDGTVFWRYKKTGIWLANETWGMRSGHHSELNPHF